VYARSTTVQAQLDAIDAGIANIQDKVMPSLMEVDGCIGMSLIVDRATGRCIATSAWESEGAMLASEGSVESIRSNAAEQFRGTVETVERWEIAVLHREHEAGESACVRCTWIEGDPDQIERSIDMYKTRVLPEVEQMDGFCSASLFVDRASGRGVGATAWASRDSMTRNKERADQLRTSTTQELGSRVLEVAEFDLAVAHLRVPEMA
jgi:hypothetical protein